MPMFNRKEEDETITFALADGAMFDNVGRGYVLRRLLRRSVRYGKQLGFNEAFLYKLVDTTVDIMKNVYPYLLKAKSNIKILIMNVAVINLKKIKKH